MSAPPSERSAELPPLPPLPPTRLPKFTAFERRAYEKIMLGRDEMRRRVIEDATGAPPPEYSLLSWD